MAFWLHKMQLVCFTAVLILLSACRAQTVGNNCNLFDSFLSNCKPNGWQYDRTCEPDRDEQSCTDCFDCDRCRTFDFDCEACVSNGCHWCAGDALCSSTAFTKDDWDTLDQKLERNNLYPSCVAKEDWNTGTCTTSNNSTQEPIFSDPLLASMTWLYDMINLRPVWKAGILGKGIHMRVNDVGGVDVTHAEFDDRFDQEHSCEEYMPDEDGIVTEFILQHGTGVASLALGGANNDQCSAGIAPEATLSACKVPSIASPFAYATLMIMHLEAIDISVNAWSLDSCYLKEQINRKRRRQRQLQETTTCPFSDEFSSSPCQYCGSSLSTMTDLAQLDSNCRLSIALYCTTRFEDDPEACSEFLSIYSECFYDSVLTEEERASLEVGVQQGRDGKGIVFVVAAGNSHKYGDSTNGQKWVNTRYTVSVGAVGKDGIHASYSATGSALFVSAPGGDLDHLSNNVVAATGGGCHDVAFGTSFSCPIVAGVVALMLEVNPELTWRDVQAIFAKTSRQVDSGDESWVINGAGFHHSYRYGFGLVDVQAAVDAAGSWESWGVEEFVTVQSDMINLPIPEGSEAKPVNTTLVLNLGTDVTVETESVAVFLFIDHPSRGDLDIVLTSPQGTASILHRSPRPENSHVESTAYWELMTVRSWGESPQGTWTLSVRDSKSGNVANDCVDVPWSVTLAASPDLPAGARVTCSSIERSGICENGVMTNSDLAVLTDPETQLSPDQACCICGGGMAPTEEATLLSWNLVVYGRTTSNESEIGTENEEEEKAKSNGAVHLSVSIFLPFFVSICVAIISMHK